MIVSLVGLRVVNLLQATFLTGFCSSLGWAAVPTVLLAPTPVLAIRQWKKMFMVGKWIATPFCYTSFALSVYLAYALSGNPETATQFWLYVAASVLSFNIFPVSLAYIQPINLILLDKHQAQAGLHYQDLPEKDAGMQTGRVRFLLPLPFPGLVCSSFFFGLAYCLDWAKFADRAMTSRTMTRLPDGDTYMPTESGPCSA